MRHRLGLATRTQISVCKLPFPSAGTAVSLFRAKTVQQRPLLATKWNSTFCVGRHCCQSRTCSTPSTLSKTGDFCRQNVERPFDLTELTRLKFDFITSVYQPLVTRWESGEQPVVPLTSAFDTWRVYDILKILHSTHVSNYLVTIKTAVGTNDYFAFTACFWFC